jgi:hypothetical protein
MICTPGIEIAVRASDHVCKPGVTNGYLTCVRDKKLEKLIPLLGKEGPGPPSEVSYGGQGWFSNFDTDLKLRN